jgi:hypothetical protein
MKRWASTWTVYVPAISCSAEKKRLIVPDTPRSVTPVCPMTRGSISSPVAAAGATELCANASVPHPIAAPRSTTIPIRRCLSIMLTPARCSVGLRIRAETSIADPRASLAAEIHTSERRLQWFRNSRGDRDAANLAERVRDGHRHVLDVEVITLGMQLEERPNEGTQAGRP